MRRTKRQSTSTLQVLELESYHIHLPSTPRVPILISVPHCGTSFPDEIKNDYKQELIQAPDDTDWLVDRLYGFAPHLGATMITAEFSRWVIDLNRNPDNRPLYTDGRITTGLCPVTTFLGQSLYKDGRTEVNPGEVKRRMEMYFRPYHDKLDHLLQELKSAFGTVLLWDCHSIRQEVPTIQTERFPDLILGSADGASAGQELIAIAIENLGSHKYSFKHNHPFKGGYITRHYGNPQKNQHALQLEMSKINYMDDAETTYDPARAAKIREVLIQTLNDLSEALTYPKD